MLNQNLKEFEMLNQQLSSVRDSINKLFALIISCSGLSFYAAFMISKPNSYELLIVILGLFSALTVCALFYAMIYKFSSHNRYAGYTRLITQEVKIEKLPIPVDKSPNAKKILDFPDHDNLIPFENCMARLQYCYNVKDDPLVYCKDMPVDYWSEKMEFEFVQNRERVEKFEAKNAFLLKNIWEKYRLNKPLADTNTLANSIIMIFKGIVKEEGTNSWKYPLYITYIVLLNIFFLEGTAIYYLIKNWHQTMMGIKIYSFLMILAMTYLTIQNIKQLYSIMKGSKTVSAYCFKFLQFRVEILNSIGLKPFYTCADIKFSTNQGHTKILLKEKDSSRV